MIWESKIFWSLLSKFLQKTLKANLVVIWSILDKKLYYLITNNITYIIQISSASRLLLKYSRILFMFHLLLEFRRSLTLRFKLETSEKGFLKPFLQGIHLLFHIKISSPFSTIHPMLLLINWRASTKPFQNHKFSWDHFASQRGLFGQYLILKL